MEIQDDKIGFDWDAAFHHVAAFSIFVLFASAAIKALSI